MTADSVVIRRRTPDCVEVALTHSELNHDLVTGLTEALHEAEARDGVRIFIITAGGPDFCTGLPLLDRLSSTAIIHNVLAARNLLTALAESPLMTVAIVDGRTTGGGVALAAACDQVVAGPQASFRITELLVGVLPAILLPVVARRTGHQHAMSLALTAPTLDAATAVARGLADRVALDAEKEMRVLVRELRRTDAATVFALKRYSKMLQSSATDTAELVEQAMREWLDDADCHARVTLLAEQGLLQ